MTIDEVAELAYVSRSVVSRVLNDHPNVSDEARERVLAVVEEHDYRPSPAARSLATDRTFEVGVLTPRRSGDAFANSFWPLLHSGISEQCRKRGYFASVSMVSADLEADLDHHFLRNKRFDGYIFITQAVTQQMAGVLRRQRAPFALIGHAPEHPNWYSVDVDNVEGARKATAHLHRLGHERIAAILGSLDMQESVDRRNGYRQALREAGLALGDEWTAEGDYSGQSGFSIMTDWIREEIGVTAVFCASDTMAMGALLALHQAGLRVPGDVAIVGFDDLPFARYTIPPLTTVHQPIVQKGRWAADLLLDQIKQDEPERKHVTLNAELKVRDSCGAAV